MQTWSELKKIEEENLYTEFKKDPSLFANKSTIEDDTFLRTFGIVIPNKHALPNGYIKLFPSDFIVEELDSNGKLIETSFKENPTGHTELKPPITVYADLIKCSLSTLDVVNELTKILNLDHKQIQYAGIKDKQAITSQRISFRGTTIEKVLSISSPNYKLTNISLGKGVVGPSSLTGNKFTILVRTEPAFFTKEFGEAFVHNFDNVQNNGFHNYFYLQRFGSPRYLNYKWGYLILQGKFRETIEHVLFTQGVSESSFIIDLRNTAMSLNNDWHAIRELYSRFPLIFKSELSILAVLCIKKDSYEEALQSIPEQIKLWVYAFASWLFNRKLAGLVEKNEMIPKVLPLLLSYQNEDIKTYEEDLKKLHIFPPNFQNLKPFPFLRMEHREVNTLEKVDVKGIEVTKQGVVLSFILSKGDYATTFLSTLFNLVSGTPTESINKTLVNTKKALGDNNFDETYDYFLPIIESDSGDIFDRIEKRKANN